MMMMIDNRQICRDIFLIKELEGTPLSRKTYSLHCLFANGMIQTASLNPNITAWTNSSIHS